MVSQMQPSRYELKYTVDEERALGHYDDGIRVEANDNLGEAEWYADVLQDKQHPAL